MCQQTEDKGDCQPLVLFIFSIILFFHIKRDKNKEEDEDAEDEDEEEKVKFKLNGFLFLIYSYCIYHSPFLPYHLRKCFRPSNRSLLSMGRFYPVCVSVPVPTRKCLWLVLFLVHERFLFL